ncbi:MAG TPA: glycosyltransferase family 4 protein [Syntrophomonadaceae bacterium]|nr:glycosyltransferase family 4 protein [Syntrophomonadaceae bacterium]HPR93383.1 glycosyltransferase family 4 protein [Syntrophomonadaceae bacterium]
MTNNGMINIAFLSTYPPRECGLATFTEDLINEIDKTGIVQSCVIAVTNGEVYDDPRVEYTMSQHQRADYFRTSRWINTHMDLLVIEHEYGIFGGECGEYILDLARNLQIPFIITTHTVLQNPSRQQRMVLKTLGSLCTGIVTMAENSIPILARVYGIEPDKVTVIPHGVPYLPAKPREQLKFEHNLNGQHVISSFGLISPAKGLEYGIKAVAQVVPKYDNLVYLILGKTHPAVKQAMGESYRQNLMNLAESLGVQDNVRFIDKYLTKAEVMMYLNLSDIYMTPYLSREQAVSGTLAYAVGCGRVIVSTPYRYAREMLGDGRGMLAEFSDADSLASCIKYILENPRHKTHMEMKTLKLGQTMTWANVAGRYIQLFINIVKPSRRTVVQVG